MVFLEFKEADREYAVNSNAITELEVSAVNPIEEYAVFLKCGQRVHKIFSNADKNIANFVMWELAAELGHTGYAYSHNILMDEVIAAGMQNYKTWLREENENDGN